MNLTLHAGERSWLAHRRLGVTSSDIPTLLGYGYAESNIFKLWWDKVHGPEPGDVEATRWKFRCGHRMEPVIAERVEEEGGFHLYDPGDYAIVEHEGGILRATVDRLRIGDAPVAGMIHRATAVHEFKWMDRSLARDYLDSKHFAYALAQVTTAMICCGLDEGEVDVAFGQMDEFQRVPVVRNAGLEELILERATEFWGYVERQEVPPARYVDESKAVGDALAAIYAGEREEVVELGAEWVERLARLKELPGEIRALEAEQQEIKNLLAHQLGEATIGIAPGSPWKAKYQLRRGGAESVDTRWERRVVSVVKA